MIQFIRYDLAATVIRELSKLNLEFIVLVNLLRKAFF